MPDALGRAPTAKDELVERIRELRESPAFENYLRARSFVLRTKTAQVAAGDRQASGYWSEELDTLDYLFDASPLIIEQLRHHTYTITGIRAYDYRTHKDGSRDRFAHKLELLQAEAGSDDLLVPESPLLGGFGHDIGGQMFNIDTLKYFEALIAMDRGGGLVPFRDASRRSVAWEIGAGWGGLPFVFKSLFPNTTYVIVDLPELFLFSATYLMTAFPEAKTLFFDRKARRVLREDWADYDFVFVPNTQLDDMHLPQLDLVLNTVSFQEMTAEQVSEYVRKAHALKAPVIYSLNRDRSLYNDELDSVTARIEERFWVHEIPILPVNYMKMVDPAKLKPKKGRPSERAALDYKHLVGKRRSTA